MQHPRFRLRALMLAVAVVATGFAVTPRYVLFCMRSGDGRLWLSTKSWMTLAVFNSSVIGVGVSLVYLLIRSVKARPPAAQTVSEGPCDSRA